MIVLDALGFRLNDVEISKAPQRTMSNADRTHGSSLSEGGCAVDQNEFSRLAELTAAQREELLDQLDKVSAASAVDNRRAHERMVLRATDVPFTVTHPGGGVGRFLVYARNISAEGMCFLHGGYLHAASHCKIDLVTTTGEQREITGRIVWCKHLTGPHHMVSAHFDQAIDPRDFVDRRHWPKSMVTAAMSQRDLAGRVLFLDDQEIDGDLLALHLRDTAVELVVAGHVGGALDELKRHSFDVVICDLNRGDTLGEHAIRSMREIGFRGPITVLTVETNPQRIDNANAAGANEVIRKPYDPPTFLKVLSKWLEIAGATTDELPIYSDLGDQPGMAKTIETYIKRVERKIHELRSAIQQDDFETVRGICQTLKATGSGYGFAALTEAADRAMVALDSSNALGESITQIQRLERLAKRLSLRDVAA